MTSLRPVILLIVLAAVAWFGWRWFVPSDEAQIRALLDRIADGISGGSSEAPVARMARAAGLRAEFDPEVVVEAGAPFAQLKGRDSVIGAAAQLHGSLRNLQIRFDDLAVIVDEDRMTARASMTAEARYDEAGGGRGFEPRELDVLFRRLDGRWVVSEVTLVRALQPITN